jgi:hypothetical protein
MRHSFRRGEILKFYDTIPRHTYFVSKTSLRFEDNTRALIFADSATTRTSKTVERFAIQRERWNALYGRKGPTAAIFICSAPRFAPTARRRAPTIALLIEGIEPIYWEFVYRMRLTEDDMSLFKTACICLAALCASAASAGAAVRFHHHHHQHLIGAPNPNFDPYSTLTGESPAATYNGGIYQGEGISRSTGGVNSMSNDFGTSGVLGHTNGQPSLPH